MIYRLIKWWVVIAFFASSSILFAADEVFDATGGPKSILFFAEKLKQGKKSGAAQDQQLQLTPVKTETSNVEGGDNKQVNAIPQTPQTYTEDMLFSIPNTQQERAFESVSRSAMPMTPEEIRQFKTMLDYTHRAAESPIGTPPKPELSVQVVSLSPGANPPVIRLQQGFVTSVLFIDDAGQPWPIESYDLGNSKAFNIQWASGSNMLMIEAMSVYTYGNIAVKLKELATPVMLTLVPGQQVVDYRVDLQVQQTRPGENPNNEEGSNNDGNVISNQILLSILNGIPPPKAHILKVSGEECQAWIVGNKMYLRTKLTVLSPGWLSMLRNPDGTKAYEMTKSPMILVSKYGKLMKLKIEGFI